MGLIDSGCAFIVEERHPDRDFPCVLQKVQSPEDFRLLDIYNLFFLPLATIASSGVQARKKSAFFTLKLPSLLVDVKKRRTVSVNPQMTGLIMLKR